MFYKIIGLAVFSILTSVYVNASEIDGVWKGLSYACKYHSCVEGEFTLEVKYSNKALHIIECKFEPKGSWISYYDPFYKNQKFDIENNVIFFNGHYVSKIFDPIILNKIIKIEAGNEFIKIEIERNEKILKIHAVDDVAGVIEAILKKE